MTDPIEHAFRDHGAALLGYLARRAPDAQDAADLLSEVFTTAWRRRTVAPTGNELRLWLFGIARNALHNHRRSSVRRSAATVRVADELARRLAPVDQVDLLDLERALDRLGATDREIILLAHWEGLTSAQIGQVLDMPAGSVRARLKKAREQVRDVLGPAPAEDAPVTAGS